MKVYLTILTILVVLMVGAGGYGLYKYIGLSDKYSDLDGQFTRFVAMTNLEQHITQSEIDKLSRIKPVNKFYVFTVSIPTDLPDPEKQEKYINPNWDSTKNQNSSQNCGCPSGQPCSCTPGFISIN